MKPSIKLKLTLNMMYSMLEYIGDAMAELSQHETIRNRNKLMILSLITSVNKKLSIKAIEHKKQYTVTLTIAEACALHEYYTRNDSHRYITNVTLVIGEIDKITA